MSRRLEEELTRLEAEVLEMGRLAIQMLESVFQALEDRDVAPLSRIDAIETRVDRFQVEIDERVVRILTLFGPVAVDLRFLLMVARVTTEVERIGDQAVNIRGHVDFLVSEEPLRRFADVSRMTEYSLGMVRQALDTFREHSSHLARSVIQADGRVDALHDSVYRELVAAMVADPGTVSRCVALLFIARSLERVSDHATNIAEEVVYMVHGEDIRHHPK